VRPIDGYDGIDDLSVSEVMIAPSPPFLPWITP
jgi:hypothetical protein